jgi:hypothetical protein
MAAITIVSSNPVQKGPWKESQLGGSIQVGMSIWTLTRSLYTRCRYEWTAKGGQSSRDLPASEQHTAAGTEYCKDRGFELFSGHEYSKDPDSNVWGVYWEDWETFVVTQYWNGSAWVNV